MIEATVVEFDGLEQIGVPDLISDLKEIGDWCMFESWEHASLERLADAGLIEIEMFEQPCIVPEPNGWYTEFAFRARVV